MERMGLVDQLTAELERRISRGWLPRDGRLPSERTLAAKEGVSRSTAREALLRLQVRGLVVCHPGRRRRALPLDESLTLENLDVALHADVSAHPERLALLEGYLALKRDTTLEVLVACCQSASEHELWQVSRACFTLRDVAYHQHERHAWAWCEFELLRVAARAARRPGLLLLIQSLERALRAMASWVLPHLDSKAMQQWALCADEALFTRDTQALRQRLPALLEASDKHVLGGLAPSPETAQPPAPPTRQATQPAPREALAPASETRDTHDAAPACAARTPPVHAVASPHEAGDDTPPEASPVALPTGPLAPCTGTGVRGAAPRPHVDSSGGDPPGAPGPNRSEEQTSSSASPPTGGPSPEPSRADPGCADGPRGAPHRTSG